MPEHQEGYAADGYPLTLSDWESALVDELALLRPDWPARAIRIAVGSPSVRERTASSPDLVRRAFLLGAADRWRPNHKGTWSPARLTVETCPLWSQALAEMEAELAAQSPPSAPRPRGRRVESELVSAGHRAPAAPSAETAALFEAGGFRLGRGRPATQG